MATSGVVSSILDFFKYRVNYRSPTKPSPPNPNRKGDFIDIILKNLAELVHKHFVWIVISTAWVVTMALNLQVKPTLPLPVPPPSCHPPTVLLVSPDGQPLQVTVIHQPPQSVSESP